MVAELPEANQKKKLDWDIMWTALTATDTRERKLNVLLMMSAWRALLLLLQYFNIAIYSRVEICIAILELKYCQYCNGHARICA
jgi:hypothetical protein